ncbi:MAG TPA: cell division protein SepF [Actinomycetota bacterium]|nr:cell division protein SepF [Actinomycetota bacterium]
MGVWRKTLLYLGLVEEDDLEEEMQSYEEPPRENPSTIRKISRDPAPMAPPRQAAPPPQQPKSLGQVHIVEPRAYDDAKEIGDKLRASVPVIMNLQGIEEDLFKRLTAFASGLAYGLEGRVQRLAPRVYLITPANVEVSAEERRRLMERGFFDEF